ncbi:MAG: VCBS repeat-containing protein [Clostridia bacterium]|nr:VCBS repeat-containing protein [Clostridia bacterium]
MKFKRMTVLVLTICISMLFCGCDLFGTADELVSPPALTGDLSPIADALYKSAGDDLDLKYPTKGDHRSAIVLEDINSDGIFEAFAFYSTSDDEMTTMHINVVCQKDSEWTSVSDQTITATAIERIEFCDLNGDGREEILVGWDVNGVSEKQLSIFCFDGKELSQQLLQAYTSFLCSDLDDDGNNEVFVHHLDTTEKTNKALIYNLGEKGIEQTAGCIMDSTVKSASTPVLAELSNGKKAIYIDEIKGVGAVTEVLYLSKGELKNPLLDSTTTIENILTLRAAALSTQDINGDKILEIPVATDLPNAVEDGEKLYYTNWCSFNGETLSVKLVTIVNTVDGYYLELPNSAVGKVSVLKDVERHERKIYQYDSQTQTTGDLLFEISAIEMKKWNSRDYDRENQTELARNADMVFVLKMGETAKSLELTEKSIKETFKLID